MNTVSIARIENISSSLHKTQQARPITQKAMKYAFACHENDLEGVYFKELGFSKTLFEQCSRVLKYMPNTARALKDGYSLITLSEAYSALSAK